MYSFENMRSLLLKLSQFFPKPPHGKDDCGNKLHIEKCLELIREALTHHENIRTRFILENEIEGYKSANNSPGAFSTLLLVLGWGIGKHLSGCFSKSTFQNLLSRCEQEFDQVCFLVEATWSPDQYWRQGREEVKAALKLMHCSFAASFERELDSLVLRGTFAALVKGVSRLNRVLEKCGPRPKKHFTMFCSVEHTYIDRKFNQRKVMAFELPFFSRVVPVPCN